jgi:hypothetical protein
MSKHIREFFSDSSSSGSPRGNFYRVVPLHEAVDVDWTTISKMVPTLPKGWFELCQLPQKDRIQFTMEFWLMKLPYHPQLTDFLVHFFASLDDLGVYLVQKKRESPFNPHMFYSISYERGFYCGSPPASEEDLDLQKLFPEYILPKDYLSFLQIHNGFWKATDCTGIISTKKMAEFKEKFNRVLQSNPPVTTAKGRPVNPVTLIPFYESFGMPYYQCFWAEWYPEKEMGNVYYSSATNTISDVEEPNSLSESMSFPTFADWLMFYLEQIA